MNVFLRKQLLLCLFLAASASIFAQVDRITLNTYAGQAVKDTFKSARTLNETDLSFWAFRPSHGSASFRALGNNRYEFTYTPENNSEGLDSLRFLYYPESFITRFRNYTITVQKSNIVANQDYTFGAENTTFSLDVLANDVSSNGVLNIASIPLVNNGTATISGNSIQFTPSSNFEGFAYINYVVCNGSGLCDNATATIQVLGENANKSDTLRIFTKKNSSQVVLIPSTFQVSTNPANGTYNTSGDAPKYTPNQDFSGTDYIRLSKGNVTKTVEVVVLDAVNNILAFDDEAYTTPAEPVELDVLDNDLYKAESGCFAIQDRPQYGSIETDGGLVIYYPPADFNGVDWFTYSVNTPGCTGAAEIATAYIYVSNFEPTATKFQMYTPKNTPLAIENDVPVANFMYKIKDQGDLGKVIILEPGKDTLVLGETIVGNNTILYIPNANVTSGNDEFEVSYCVLDAVGECAYEKSIKIEVEILDINVPAGARCVRDCIWPGDTNLDGIVDIEDLLPLGLAMGAVGPARSETSAIWYGQRGNDWNAGIDIKHLDTDGNGFIASTDTTAINTYYGKTHGLNSVSPVFYKYDIALGGDVFVNPGDLVELDLIMGSEENPALDVYGFTFPFEYNPLIFKPESVQIDLSGSNWFGYNSPVLYMSKNNQKGLVQAAITRTNGVSASGIGSIGKVRFTVGVDVDGGRPNDNDETIVKVGGIQSFTTNSTGQTFGINVKPATIHIIRKTKEEIENTPLTADLLKVYPNPTQDLLNIHLNGGQEFEQVLVYNMTGQLVFNSGKTLGKAAQINVSNLQNGLYIVSVQTAKGLVNKKFEVIR